MSKTVKKVFIVKVSLSSAQSQRCVEQCRFYFVQCQGQSAVKDSLRSVQGQRYVKQRLVEIDVRNRM